MTNQENKKSDLLEFYKENNLLEKLYKLVYILRNYCPWDKEQTLESLQQSLLEESYEVIQGIQEKDQIEKVKILKEELGDLLFLIHFIVYLCEEKGYFDLNTLYNLAMEKLIERHPHIFLNHKVENSKEVLKNWESFKKKEFGENTEFLPALMRAQKIQKKASLEGFDWQEKEDKAHLKEILNIIKKEIEELENEIFQDNQNKKNLELELGDVLFSIVNLARHLNISSEISLHKSIEKFIKRFKKVMEIYKKNYINSESNKSQILEEIYQNIKKNENKI